jgi:hypothetical protein
MTSVTISVPAGTFNYMSPEAVKETQHTKGDKPACKVNVTAYCSLLGCCEYNNEP